MDAPLTPAKPIDLYRKAEAAPTATEPQTLADLIDQSDKADAERHEVFKTLCQGQQNEPALVAAREKCKALSARLGQELWAFADDEGTTTYRHGDAIYVLGEDRGEYYLIHLKDCVDTASVNIAPVPH